MLELVAVLLVLMFGWLYVRKLIRGSRQLAGAIRDLRSPDRTTRRIAREAMVLPLILVALLALAGFSRECGNQSLARRTPVEAAR